MTDDGDLKNSSVCDTNFRQRDTPRFCGQCGLAFHARCMDGNASERCQLCTVILPDKNPARTTTGDFQTPARSNTRQQPVKAETVVLDDPGAPTKSMLEAQARLALLRRATGGNKQGQYKPQSLDSRMTGKYPAMGLSGLHITPRFSVVETEAFCSVSVQSRYKAGGTLAVRGALQCNVPHYQPGISPAVERPGLRCISDGAPVAT